MDQGARYYAEAREAIFESLEARRRTLVLAARGLRSLPSEIGLLRDLEVLDLRNNRLAGIPVEVGRLSRLRELHLDTNRIRELPDEICGLENLRSLSLSSNFLESLPNNIGSLRQLNSLTLSHNNLRSLPRSLAELEGAKLHTIDLDLNPFDEPLPSLIRAGTTSLFAYLRSLGDGEAQYEAKLLLVGEGEVGKSSLLAALRDEDFVEGRSTTHGIEIRQLAVTHPGLANVSIKLNAWDFGGQEVYRITHQFFFSRRSLYLLVWNPRQGQEANEVEDWVKRIRLRTGDEARVIIVSTHADVRRAELDYRALQQSYPQVVIGRQEVDSKSGSGIRELANSLAVQAARLPQMGELLSRKWATAREEILARPEPQMSLEELNRICQRNGLDAEESTALAALLHDLGHIIHYADDAGLRDIVVLQPEWLTKAIGYVFEDQLTRDDGGVLSHGRLREIWGREGRAYPERYYPYFLRLMEKFDVSYRLPGSHSSLIGQLVPYERPAPLSTWEATANGHVRRLILICTMEDEAPGLISWLTVRNSRFSVGHHWRRGVYFRHNDYASDAMVELATDRSLSLEVRAPSPDYLFSILRDSLEELISLRWPGLAYDFLIPCPGDEETGSCAGRFAFKTLQRYREKHRLDIECPQCLELRDVTLLLTGFNMPRSSMQESLAILRENQKAVAAGLMRVEEYAADTASQTRAILKAISSEFRASPRIFTLRPSEAGLLAPSRLVRETMSLTLWCEHPGAEHSCRDATYAVRRNHKWVQDIAPYGLLVAKMLRLFLPVGRAAVSELFDPADAARITVHLDMVKDLAAEVKETGVHVDVMGSQSAPKITIAEGAGLRALAALLEAEDPSHGWGGLRRRLTASGDYLWICPDHYELYDPGLPTLPPQMSN